MTVTLNLPPNIEQAFIGEAAFKGLTLDEFLREILLIRAAWQNCGVQTGTDSPSAILQVEDGVPVLRTNHPVALQAINETLEQVRLERDLRNFGTL